MWDKICDTCGCVIGAGCPDSTQDEKDDWSRRHASEIISDMSREQKIAVAAFIRNADIEQYNDWHRSDDAHGTIDTLAQKVEKMI